MNRVLAEWVAARIKAIYEISGYLCARDVYQICKKYPKSILFTIYSRLG